MSVVLDASALLALLHREPGDGQVAAALPGARVSTVNWSEVLARAIQKGVHTDGLTEELVEAGVLFRPFSVHHAEMAARLRERTRPYGLSLADRACLALALDEGLPVVTADRAWRKLEVGVEIRLIR